MLCFKYIISFIGIIKLKIYMIKINSEHDVNDYGDNIFKFKYFIVSATDMNWDSTISTPWRASEAK